jgi:hypothetical protein
MNWKELLRSCDILPTDGELTIYEKNFPQRSIWSQEIPAAMTYAPNTNMSNYLPGGNAGLITSLVVNAGGLKVETESFFRQRPSAYRHPWDNISYIKTYKSLGDTYIETSIGVFGNDRTLSTHALHSCIVFYSSLARSATGSGMPLIEYSADISAIDKYKADGLPFHEFISDQGRASDQLRQIAQSKEGHKFLKDWLSPCLIEDDADLQERIEDQHSSTEQELRKVEDLANKGLISDEEKRLMRNKILGI